MEKTMNDDIFLNEMKIRWMRSEISYSRWAASFGLTLNEVWILLILSTFAKKSCKQANLVGKKGLGVFTKENRVLIT